MKDGHVMSQGEAQFIDDRCRRKLFLLKRNNQLVGLVDKPDIKMVTWELMSWFKEECEQQAGPLRCFNSPTLM